METIQYILSFLQEILPIEKLSNLTWWVTTLGAVLFACICFLLNHLLKGKLIDAKPKPTISLYYNGKESTDITIDQSEPVDLAQNITTQVNQHVKELCTQYPFRSLDVYQNPFLALGNNLQHAQTYNNEVKSYIDSMQRYYQRIYTDKVYAKVFIPVKLHLVAKGNKTCSNLHVTISLEGEHEHLYSDKSVVAKKGTREKAPESQEFYEEPMACFFLSSDQESYTYNEWNLQHPNNIIEFNVAKLVSGVPDTSSAPYFYIDTRHKQTIQIKWKINGDDIDDAGKIGTLRIVVK